jgi:hypothetical protein
VVDVEVGEEQAVDCLDLGDGEISKAGLAAIEQQSMDRLTGIDFDEQGVVAARLAEDLVTNRHSPSLFVGTVRVQRHLLPLDPPSLSLVHVNRQAAVLGLIETWKDRTPCPDGRVFLNPSTWSRLSSR